MNVVNNGSPLVTGEKEEMKAQIAAHLKVSEQSIKEIREWAKVYLVIFHRGLGLRPRFVSKKAVRRLPSPREAVARINEAHYQWDCDGKLSAKLWQVPGKCRIYLSVDGTSRHLQKRGYISVNGDRFDFSQVGGFGHHAEVIKELIYGY